MPLQGKGVALAIVQCSMFKVSYTDYRIPFLLITAFQMFYCSFNLEIPHSVTNDKSKWRFLRPLRYRRNDNHLYIEPGDEGGGFAAAFIPLIYIKQCHPDARVFCGQRDLNFTFFVISLQAFGQMLKLGMTIAYVH
jgi:hypothetical protein